MEAISQSIRVALRLLGTPDDGDSNYCGPQGGERTAAVNQSRGTCQNAFSMDVIIDKFFRNSGGHFPLHRAQEFIDYVLNVEETEGAIKSLKLGIVADIF